MQKIIQPLSPSQEINPQENSQMHPAVAAELQQATATQTDATNPSFSDKFEVTSEQANVESQQISSQIPSVGIQTAQSLTQSTMQPNRANKVKSKKVLLSVSLLLLILGVNGFVVLRHKDEPISTIVEHSSSGVKSTKDPADSKAALLDTSGWQTYTDPTMKIRFQYPASIKTGRVQIYPSKPESSSELIRSEVGVEAEITKTGSSGIVTPIFSSGLIDIITYAPGSPNDVHQQKLSDKAYITDYKTKILTIDKIKGQCEYYALKSDPSQQFYSCKFNRDNLIYSITAGAASKDVAKQFSGVDLWGISITMLQTLHFTS